MKSTKLTFQNYYTSLGSGLINFQQNEEFVDMTIAADGHLVKVHKNVVSLASPYIKEMIKNAPCSHPVLYLSNIKYDIFCMILEYIYTGEVQVSDHIYNDFVKAAKELHIVGLAGLIKRSGISFIQNQVPVEEKQIQSQLPETNSRSGSLHIPQSINKTETLHNVCDSNENANYLESEDLLKSTQNQNSCEKTNNAVNLHNAQQINITNIESSNQNELESYLYNNQFLKFVADSGLNKQTDIIAIDNDENVCQKTMNGFQVNTVATLNENCNHNQNINNENLEQIDQIKVQFSQKGKVPVYTFDGTTADTKEISINLSEIGNNREATKLECDKILGKLTYILTTRAQVQLIYNRFIYYVHHKTKSGRQRFRCIDYRGGNCPAIIDMENEIIVKRTNMHNHHYHDSKIEMKLRRQRTYESIAEASKFSQEEMKKLKQISEIDQNLNLDVEMLL